MENKKLWYAVQKDSTDEWGNGSFDREEAVKMLKKQGYGLIAVIDEETQTCVEEIALGEIVDIIGEQYEDPEGIWEVIEVDGDEVTVKNIQEGNINEGKEFCVDYDEAKYYINGGK